MTRWHDPAPGEREAGDRSWELVRSAFEERIPVPRKRDWRPIVAVAFGLALLAAAFSAPGNAVLDRCATRCAARTAWSRCLRAAASSSMRKAGRGS